jgi:DNA-binding NtrC family response regulator
MTAKSFNNSGYYVLPAVSVLITEITDSDPFTPGLISGDYHPGPLITLLRARHFDKVVILGNETDSERIRTVLAEVHKLFPSLYAETESLQPPDHAAYNQTGEALQHMLDGIRARNPDCSIFVSLNKCNPVTLVAWVRLVYRYSALTLLNVRQSLHATADMPQIDTIEESKPAKAPETSLRETPEPMADDVARSLDLIGTHPCFRHLLGGAAAIARFDVPVLITGEAGSGKTSLAQFVWRTSQRSRQPLQVADPTDLPDSLASMLLFGHADGDANTFPCAGVGKIASSNNATLLIENVEKLNSAIQDELAQYIQTGMYQPAGATEFIHSNTRLIFTSCDRSSEGPISMTPSLKEKLVTTMLQVPSLRERSDDIPLIALHYLRRINLSLKSARSIPRNMLKTMQQYPWHGNVRELRLAVERAALLSQAQEISIDAMNIDDDTHGDIARSVSNQIPDIGEHFSLETYLGDMRRRLILHALELSKGNQSEAARMLNITPQAVHQFLKFKNKVGKSKPLSP